MSESGPGRRVLLTGGAGYIGSHVAVALAAAGDEPILLDSFINSDRQVPERLRRITGLDASGLPLLELDLQDTARLRTALRDEVARGGPIAAVLHFAALKAVGESVQEPLRYYENNIGGTLSLLRVMTELGIPRLVFSSSATVYGDPDAVPIPETAALRPTNPYGRSKLMMEQALSDVARAAAGTPAPLEVVLLRYFNPVGAHESGLIGDDPAKPANLMPVVARVASGELAELSVFGQDWPTRDGTGMRDYIHIEDLAEAHVTALTAPPARDGSGTTVYNVGTGVGHSVLELVAAFERESGRAIPRRFVARRPGDVATLIADSSRIAAELGWRARRTLADMVRSAWRYHRSAASR